jgi:hypothetical protein
MALAADTPVVAAPVAPVPIDTIPMVIAPRAAVPAHQQTLADLGDRLTWIAGLVEEIQLQTRAAPSPRLTEIAGELAESMSEIRELHRKLDEQLATREP